MGAGITDWVDPGFNKIIVKVENLWENTNFGPSPLLDEFRYFLVELNGCNVLIAISCGKEFKTLVMEFDHNFCYSPL